MGSITRTVGSCFITWIASAASMVKYPPHRDHEDLYTPQGLDLILCKRASKIPQVSEPDPPKVEGEQAHQPLSTAVLGDMGGLYEVHR